MTKVKNLTVYGGQPIDAVMNESMTVIDVLNDALIEKFKKKKRP